jgi:L-ascorbate peroxidase
MQACRPVHSRAVSRSVVRVSASSKAEQLKGAKKALEGIISSSSCNPIVVRLAWHDSGTYNKNVTEPWPAAGGATASIRFKPELTHGANAGLNLAIAIVEPVKVDFPGVSYSDLFQQVLKTVYTSVGLVV